MIPHLPSAARRLVVVFASLTVAAQEPVKFGTAETWLVQYLAPEPPAGTEPPPRVRIDDAVHELLVDETAGFGWLTGRRREAEADAPRKKAMDLLITNTVIEFMRRRHQSGITFAGQYEGLRALQPWSGALLVELLFDTPQWYPHTHRVRLVRPLRDVCPQAPSEAHMARALALVESSIEPEELRRAVACLLWQWGNKQPAKERLDALRRESGEGDAEDRIRILTSLAELQYELLDYRASAATYRAVQALAASTRLDLKPIVLYASACSHALIGDVEHGLEVLDRCAARLASPHLDATFKLERSLWENDPEIASLRRDPRFAAIFARAFAPTPEPEKR